MAVIEHVRPRFVVLQPQERVTVETVAELTEAIRRQLDAGRARLVVDFAQVTYIDSIGLGAIVSAHISAWRRGGGVKLMNLSRRNERVFGITRLLTVIDTCESEEDVVRSFESQASASEAADTPRR